MLRPDTTEVVLPTGNAVINNALVAALTLIQRPIVMFVRTYSTTVLVWRNARLSMVTMRPCMRYDIPRVSRQLDIQLSPPVTVIHSALFCCSLMVGVV